MNEIQKETDESVGPWPPIDLVEKQKKVEELADRIWPVIKRRVGLRTHKHRPKIILSQRMLRSNANRRRVKLSTGASDGVLVHELLHSAMMMAGAVRRTKTGRHLHHTNRMKLLERDVCNELGIPVNGWAGGIKIHTVHHFRKMELKEAKDAGCPECGGQLEKYSAVPSFGTCYQCNRCGRAVWV